MTESVWKKIPVRGWLGSLLSTWLDMPAPSVSGWLDFSKWFKYQSQDLSNVHNSADDVRSINDKKLGSYLWIDISNEEMTDNEIHTFWESLDSNQEKRVNSRLDDGTYTNQFIKNYVNNWDRRNDPFASWNWMYEEKKSPIEKVGDWFASVFSNMTFWPQLAAQGISDTAYGLSNMFYGLQWDDAEVNLDEWKRSNAVTEYALDNYTHWYNISDEDWAKVEDDLAEDDSILDEYTLKQNVMNGLLEIGAWWLITAATATPWWMLLNWLFSAWIELPIAKQIITAATFPTVAVWEIWWFLAENLLPWVWNRLSTELQESLKMLGWWWAVWKHMNKKLNKKTGENRTFSETVMDVLKNPIEFYKEVSNALKTEKTLKNATNKLKIAGKIAWWTEWETAIEENKITSRALDFLKDAWIDLSKIKNDPEMLKALWENSDMISAIEDVIYSTDQRRLKKWQTETDVTTTDEFWLSDSYTKKQIEKWFNVLKEIYKDNEQISSQIRILEKRWEQIWLTRQEGNVMARMISEWAKIYKETTRDRFTAEYIKEIESVRRWLKEWAREPFKNTVPQLYEALEYLDSAWSDNLNLQAITRRNIWKQTVEENKTPWQEEWQGRSSAIDRTVSSKWRNVLQYILRSKQYNPLTRAADLNRNLRKYQAADTKTWRENLIKWVIEWYNQNNKTPLPEYVGEWEVIYPKSKDYSQINNYLEDIIEIVEKEETSQIDSAALENAFRALWLDETAVAEAKKTTWIFQNPFEWFWEAVKVADVNDWVATKTSKKGKKTWK